MFYTGCTAYSTWMDGNSKSVYLPKEDKATEVLGKLAQVVLFIPVLRHLILHYLLLMKCRSFVIPNEKPDTILADSQIMITFYTFLEYFKSQF